MTPTENEARKEKELARSIILDKLKEEVESGEISTELYDRTVEKVKSV